MVCTQACYTPQTAAVSTLVVIGCTGPACVVHKVLRSAFFSGFSAGWNVICYKLETRQLLVNVSSLSP